ncbi:MAG: hypothetical protein ABFS17_02190 [Chloroflexota bacterium]
MAKPRRRSKPGKKHKNLFVTHSMNRIWRRLLVASILIWAAWWAAPYAGSFLRPPFDLYLEYAGLASLGLTLLAFLMRNRGFIQARGKFVHLRGVLFRIRIPYERIDNVRMAVFREVYRGVKLSWAQRRFFKKHYKETVATLILDKYPRPRFLLRILLPSYVFLPRGDGFLVLVKDYVLFNTEVDSRLDASRDQQRFHDKSRKPGEDEYDGYFNTFDD